MLKSLSPSQSWILVAGLLVSGSAPGAARGQQVTVTGLVVERTQSSWIGGATVRLSGSPPFFTDLDGAFQFTRVTPGRHTLTVEAMGYRTRSVELEIRSDTALTIELDPDPILLDSLLVRSGNVRIRGEILDAQTGRGVPYAQVSVIPGLSTVGAINGYFNVKGVPIGRAVTVLVEAIEYLPARIALITEADTSLTIVLEHDSVGIKLLAQQVEKLESRSHSIPYTTDVIDRKDMALYPGWTTYEIVQARLKMIRYGRRIRDDNPICLFIDDRLQLHVAVLWALWAGEVERVEIYDRGGMVRAYTKRFVVGLGSKKPGPMLYFKGGFGPPVCR
jgi:hypothetical protein